MMQFWIGDSQQYIAVQYAKSNRSTCRKCKEKIPKNQLRIGLLIDDQSFPTSLWFHKDCFHFKPRHKVIDTEMVQMIYGIEDLDPEDCDMVVTFLEQRLKQLKQGKQANKLKFKSAGAEDQKKQQSQKSEEKQQEKKDVKKKRKNNKKQQEKKFISAEQETKFQQLLSQYQKMSSNELKQLLGKNGQSKTGNKDELAAKCADGKLFGKIPMCAKCGGGKLRFDRENGTYQCPGYMQDTQFKHCKAKFTFQEVKREEWTQ